jgi:hypothetical protein
MCGFLLHWCRKIGDVFNMKRSPCGFNFCLLYVEISLVDNRTSFNRKNPSYHVLTFHDFYPLVVSDDLNGCGADCVHLSSLKLHSCPEVTRNQSDTCSDWIHNCLDMMWIWYTSLSLSIGNICLLIHQRKITQLAPSLYATSVAPSAGVTCSTALSAAEAWNFCRQTAEFLEGLKNRDANQQGNLFTPSLFLSFDLFGWLVVFSICSVA